MRKFRLCCVVAASATTLASLAPATAAQAGSAQPSPDRAGAGALEGDTAYMPQPTPQEEFVYLRDIIAQQALRLDQAEQILSRQSDIIDEQSEKISALQNALEDALTGLRSARYAGAPGSAPGSGGDFYIVREGESVSAIAMRLGVSEKALAAANGLAPPFVIRTGQRLRLPARAAETRTAQAQAATAKQSPRAATAEAAAGGGGAAVQTETKTANVASAGAGTAPARTRASAAADGTRAERTATAGETPEAVGERPEEERPYLAVYTDVGGILTPRGSLFLEPAVEYSVTSDNRFFFQGLNVAAAVLIGAIEATDSDRRALTESLTLRYGLTNRLEVDGRVAYVARDDRVSGISVSADSDAQFTRELDSSGFGDAEVGLHYQLNDGRRFPYAIANLRAKAPTGEGPFDIERDENGADTELATGSGFWTIEPSLTFILPSDPAVIFGNIGYQANLATSPNTLLNDSIVTSFDPGDAIRASLGIGLSLNERLSMNFAYDQSYFLESETVTEFVQNDGQVIRTRLRQPTATVGSFLFGGSYAVNDRLRINFNSAFGATDEAPDARVSLRAQYRLFD